MWWKKLYSVKYPAKGSVQIASKLQSLLKSNGIDSKLDENRGLDHGAWDVLYLMYTKASIPVVQVSVNPYLSMEKQYEIGRAIRELGKEDILIIGSGNKDKPKLLHQSYVYGTLSYICFEF